MLNEIVDEMLNEDVSSLNRQTLKDRLLNKVKEFDLNMKPLYAEYTIDRSKIIFYYE